VPNIIGRCGGGGSITQVESSDGSVSVTNGTGPIVDLSIEIASWTQTIAQADQSITNSVAKTQDAELFFSVTATKSYVFELYLVYGSPAGLGAPDFQVWLGDSATQDGWVSCWGMTTADAIFSSAFLMADTTHFSVGTNPTGADRTVTVKGGFTALGTTFRVYIAQNIANVSPTIRRSGSLIRYTQLTH
jgi:hypothetical protein